MNRLTRTTPGLRFLTAALAALAVLTTSGCANGFNAGTRIEATGSGVDATLESGLGVRGAILVGDAQGMAFVGSVVNDSDTDDTLDQVIINGEVAAAISGGGVPVVAGTAVQIGMPASEYRVLASGVELTPSSFVPVTLYFRTAGRVDVTLLVKPRSGIYADIPTE